MAEPQPGEPILFAQPGRMRLLAIMGSIVVAVLVVALLTSGNLRNALVVGDVVLVVSCLGVARSAFAATPRALHFRA